MKDLNVTYETPYLLINGKRVSASGRSTRQVLDPTTGQSIAELPNALEADLDEAIRGAEKTFHILRKLSPATRSSILRKAASLIRERVEHIAPLMTLEQGKPLNEARAELASTADVIEWQAEQGRRSYGRIIDSPVSGATAFVVKEPVGPVAAFSPWNYPAFMPGRKIATALAAGCSIVIKPAEETPLTALKVAEAFIDAGLPEGALSVVFGEPSFVSSYLIRSALIKKISFTGSTPIGKQLATLASEGLKRMTMELGGHAPTIIFEDADIDRAVQESATHKFKNAGQICIAPSRFYIHEKVYDRFIDGMIDAVGRIKVGHGLDKETKMGPMANSRRVDAMGRLIHDAKNKGAQLAIGGKRIGSSGCFFEPTVLSHLSDDCAIMNEEPFGPVVAATSFRDDEEVILRANRLPFGLAGFFFTKRVDRIKHIVSDLQVGLVGVNTCSVAIPEAPFGGVKESGVGSEGGIEGIESHLVTKFVHQV